MRVVSTIFTKNGDKNDLSSIQKYDRKWTYQYAKEVCHDYLLRHVRVGVRMTPWYDFGKACSKWFW
jgi:hypothetical protein